MNIIEIRDYLQQNYPNIGKIKKIDFLEHNNINSINYKICSHKSTYLLRNFTDGSQYKKINQMCKILDYCVKHKAKVHKPIQNSKNHFVDYKNKFYLTKFYEGTFFNGSKKELLDIAHQLAFLHKILSKNVIPYNFRINQKFYQIIQSTELQNVLKIIHDKKTLNNFDYKILKNFDYLQQILDDFKKLSTSQKLPKLSKQLIHHDLHPKNVIFSGSKVVVIIDFNTMRKGEILDDLAFTSYRFSSYNSKTISSTKKNIQIFLNKYLEYNPVDVISENLLNFYFIQKMLGRLSLIIRKNYFSKNDLWTFDFENHLHALKLAHESKIFKI